MTLKKIRSTTAAQTSVNGPHNIKTVAFAVDQLSHARIRHQIFMDPAYSIPKKNSLHGNNMLLNLEALILMYCS